MQFLSASLKHAGNPDQEWKNVSGAATQGNLQPRLNTGKYMYVQ